MDKNILQMRTLCILFDTLYDQLKDNFKVYQSIASVKDLKKINQISLVG